MDLLPRPEHAEHRLHERLAGEEEGSAHSRYDALVRRLTRFENALECVGWPTPEDEEAPR